MKEIIEWAPYPIATEIDGEVGVIRWSDGSEDYVPADFGDAETILQLDAFMEKIFVVSHYNLFVGQSGQFIDRFPELFRQTDGVLTLRVSRDEDFLAAFVCKSKDPVECLLSWFRGDLATSMQRIGNTDVGADPFLWVSLQEVVALIGSGLLSDTPPVVFSMETDQLRQAEFDQKIKEAGLEKVELSDGWWFPPTPAGPGFGYPAEFFRPESYAKNQETPDLVLPTNAIGIEHRLSESEWEQLVSGSLQGTIAELLFDGSPIATERFDIMRNSLSQHFRVWESRWKELEW